MLTTTLVVSFYKDGRGSVNVKLWFLVVCVRYEVICRLVSTGNVFLLILIPATTHFKIIEGCEDSSHPIQAYKDGSKNDLGVGAGIAIFLDNNLKATLKYRLNGRCTNNQAEQMAILKALEYIQYTESGENQY